MKKRLIIDLIRAHAQHNDPGFRSTAYEIAREFATAGDSQIAQFIMAQLATNSVLVPQEDEGCQFSEVFRRVQTVDSEPLPLPEVILEDVKGLLQAIRRHYGVNKILFEGAPGTGKTETVKQMARLLERDLYTVDFSLLIDSRLGQTAKNITAMFAEMNACPNPDGVLFLLDEIDALALDRLNRQDLREMGRVTSTVLKELDEMNDNVCLVATTNLASHFDKAFLRRFDIAINFNRYEPEDLIEVADRLLDFYLNRYKRSGRRRELFHKILKLMDPLPYPGDLKNLIKTSIVLSPEDEELSYLRRLYRKVTEGRELSIEELRNKGMTVREIETVTGISKSSVSRELKEKA